MNEEYKALVKLLNDTNDKINKEVIDTRQRISGKNILDKLALDISRTIGLLNDDFSEQDFLNEYVSNF